MPWIRDPHPARGDYRWVYPPGVGPDPPSPPEAAEPAATAREPEPEPEPAPAPAPPPRSERKYVEQCVKSFEERMRERELDESRARDPHNRCHRDVALVKEMGDAYAAIMHVLGLQCERIHKRYVEDGLDPIAGALRRQYSVTAKGTLNVRRVTLRLKAVAQPSRAKSAMSRGNGVPLGKYDAIGWSLLVMPETSPYRMAVNDALANAGYNNGNSPDGLAQIPVNLPKSLKYALNAIWAHGPTDDDQDEMVADDLLPDGPGNFDIEEVRMEETPATNSKKARSESGASDDGASVSDQSARQRPPERNPDVAWFDERFGRD